MTDLPTTGGSFTRDLLTGALVRQPDSPAPQPEPQSDTPPAAPKGGK